MAAELALTVNSCISLGQKALTTYRHYREADAIVADKVTIIEAQWLRLETQLTFLSSISGHLDPRLAESQFALLQRLEGRLTQATTHMDLPDNKILRRLKVALAKRRLDELVAELEEWQGRFDPTWFTITLIGDSVIDKELWDRRNGVGGGGAKAFDEGPLHNMLALRHAIQTQKDSTTAALQDVNLRVTLDAAGLDNATVTPIQFSSARMVRRKGSSRLLIAETIDLSGGYDVALLQRRAEYLARKLKRVDPIRSSLLPCHGIVKHRNEHRNITSVDILFSALRDSRSPTSLRQLLLQQEPVSASAIVRIAKQLTHAVSYIHSYEVVHKNIRPESIVVFPSDDSPLGASYLIGLNQFRETSSYTLRAGDLKWHLNLYRHPQRQGTQAEERYIMQHDIYSLGVCLLEIGIWRSFVWYPDENEDAAPVPSLSLGLSLSDQDFQSVRSSSQLYVEEHLVALAKRELPPRLGDKYTEIVVACLSCLEPGNTVFGSEEELTDENGVLIGVRFVEKILLKMADISI